MYHPSLSGQALTQVSPPHSMSVAPSVEYSRSSGAVACERCGDALSSVAQHMTHSTAHSTNLSPLPNTPHMRSTPLLQCVRTTMRVPALQKDRRRVPAVKLLDVSVHFVCAKGGVLNVYPCVHRFTNSRCVCAVAMVATLTTHCRSIAPAQSRDEVR